MTFSSGSNAPQPVLGNKFRFRVFQRAKVAERMLLGTFTPNLTINVTFVHTEPSAGLYEG